LVIDQTETRIGHEFYWNFVNVWEAPAGIKDYNIFITERASPVWGSWIWIEVGDFVSKEIVYQEILKSRSRSKEIEEAAKKGGDYSVLSVSFDSNHQTNQRNVQLVLLILLYFWT